MNSSPVGHLTVLIILIVFAAIFLAISFFLLYINYRRKIYNLVFKIKAVIKQIDVYNVSGYFNKISKVSAFNKEYQTFYKKNFNQYNNVLLPRFNELKNKYASAVNEYARRSGEKKYYYNLMTLFNSAEKLDTDYNQIINECKKILQFQEFSRTMIVYLQDRFQKVRHVIENKNYQLFSLAEQKLSIKIQDIKKLFSDFDVEGGRLNKMKMELISNKIKQELTFLESCVTKLPSLTKLATENFRNRLQNLDVSYRRLQKDHYNLRFLNFSKTIVNISKNLSVIKQLISQLQLNEAEDLCIKVNVMMANLEQRLSFEITCHKLVHTPYEYVKLIKETKNLASVLWNEVVNLRTSYVFSPIDNALVTQWKNYLDRKVNVSVLQVVKTIKAAPDKIPDRPYHEYAFEILKIVNYLNKSAILNQKLWFMLIKMRAVHKQIMQKTKKFYDQYNNLITDLSKYNENFAVAHQTELKTIKDLFAKIDANVREKQINLRLTLNLFTKVKNQLEKLETLNQKIVQAKKLYRKKILKINAFANKSETILAQLAAAKKMYEQEDYSNAVQMLDNIISNNSQK